MADYNKEVTKSYGVFFDEAGGIALRGTFIIDPQGIVQHISINNIDVGRSVSEVLRTLKACQTGAACPVDWDEGQKTL